MAKPRLNLTIDADLLEIAKSADINLSAEFEEWLKIRLGQSFKEVENVDYDKEYARLQLELQKLESKKELKQKEEQKDKEQLMVLDHAIDNERETPETKLEDIPLKRAPGIKYLFKQKFNINLSDSEAIKLLDDRIKERGLI